MSEIVDAPASTSTSVTMTGNETVTLADEVKKYDTAGLISFLQGQGLGLSEKVYKILENEEVIGRDFLKMTKQRLRDYGMKGGPALRLADFAKECKEKKLHSFSSYKTKKDLSEVLRKYSIDSNDIKKIPPFIPELVEIDGADKYF
ncbi:hypothetical protein RhiirA5_434032 [Rhizophagus irregularis]|uniref:SAM domain-containing protein n=1 Tax=Rhizophagus irregularis TaxID=588596 RepID=A0A2N0NQS0_9GLOM|nr:hypothetical protein RhiirA5_434032 [Rhizophagus irregularis]PKC54508.1 hypothetical protein RhiirA1_477203 [Rhizophagus irregularis]